MFLSGGGGAGANGWRRVKKSFKLTSQEAAEPLFPSLREDPLKAVYGAARRGRSTVAPRCAVASCSMVYVADFFSRNRRRRLRGKSKRKKHMRGGDHPLNA